MAHGISLLRDAAILELDPATIDEELTKRQGFYFPDKATALGRLMAVDGQRDPIKVSRKGNGAKLPWRLHVGLHRLMGARLEGIPVYAIEVSGAPEQLVDLEASENLHRRSLAPIEKAKFTAALVRAAQERLAREHGNLTAQQRGAKARWDNVRSGEVRAEQALNDEVEDASANIALAYSWEESVGEVVGMSRRAIYDDLRLFRLVIEPFPDLSEPLARHPVVGENGSQLKAIAAVRDEAQRRSVIERILADPELSADEARVQIGIGQATCRAPTHFEKFSSQISGAWSRFGKGERERFVRDGGLIKLLTPGLMRTLREQIDAELGDEG